MLKKKNKFVKKVFKFSKFYKKIIIFHIFSTFNNTIITLTNKYGDTISWITASNISYKSYKKSAYSSSQLAGERISKKAINLGFRKCKIFLKGFGIGRDFSIRGIFSSGINVISVTDITSIPHNGCKFKKIRRN